jgi:hypothetical protein
MPKTASTDPNKPPGGSTKHSQDSTGPSVCPFSAQALASRISTKNFAAVVVKALQSDLSDPSAVLEDGIVLLSQNAVILDGLKKTRRPACTGGR